jgi:hypothetical protein
MRVRAHLPFIVDATEECRPSIAPAITAEPIHAPVVNSIRICVSDSIDPLARAGCDLGHMSRSMSDISRDHDLQDLRSAGSSSYCFAQRATKAIIVGPVSVTFRVRPMFTA